MSANWPMMGLRSHFPLPVFTLWTVEAAHKTWAPHILQHSAGRLTAHMVMTSRFPAGRANWRLRLPFACHVRWTASLSRDVSTVFISWEVKGHVWTWFFPTGSPFLTTIKTCGVCSCSFYWPASVTVVLLTVCSVMCMSNHKEFLKQWIHDFCP